MPKENSNGFERLRVSDSTGRVYYAALFKDGCSPSRVASSLVAHLGLTPPEKEYHRVAGSLKQLDGGKHTERVYLVYDPYETLQGGGKVVARSWD